MKNRIIAVLLAFLVGIGCFASFTSFMPSVSYAVSFGNILDFLFFIKGLDESHVIEKKLNALTPEGLKARSEVLASFKPIREKLPSDLSKSDYQQLLVRMMTSDNYSVILETYGKDVADFYSQYQVELSDFLRDRIFPLFNGIEDFVNALFDSNLDGYGTDDKGNVQMPVEDFAKEIAKQNNTITPKNRQMYRYSWRDLSDTQANYSSSYLARCIGDNGYFIDGASYADGVYIQPYFIVGDVENNLGVNCMGEYYSGYQYRIYLDRTEGEAFVGDQGSRWPNYTYTWYYDALFYQCDENGPVDTYTGSFGSYSSSLSSSGVYDSANYPYVSFGFYHLANSFYLSLYDNKSLCLNGSTSKKSYNKPQAGSVPAPLNNYIIDYLKSDDVLTKININTLGRYITRGTFSNASSGYPLGTTTLSKFNSSFPDDDITDYGFFVSAEPFTTTFLFDPSKFPVNSTITITGDTVYDYTITNNTTGDTTTIYNYYINNYEFPEDSGDNGNGNGNGNSSGSVSGGGLGGDVNVSGDINVGGRVDVGGKVEVDVNVNVTGGLTGGAGGSGGTTGGYSAVGDYELPDMSPLDGYLDNALEETSGIRKFFAMFFGFLPAEIVMLLGIGLTVVILARIFGR